MGEIGGFLRNDREGLEYRDALERIDDFQEFLEERSEEELSRQGGRCMDCGVPFCHNGCPLGNLIPDWNDMVYRRQWREAIVQLHATNNFPEFTGRLCPAPCEAACVLEIRENNSVTIKQIELAIIDRAWREGWIEPLPPKRESGKSVAVIGSGPAGMAAAQQLRRSGHRVVLFERDEAAGGLVRFGVPHFKIQKDIVERRLEQMRDEGVEIVLSVDVGQDVGAEEIRSEFDAMVLATGSRVPRDLDIEGRDLSGIHFAMDYLYDRARSLDDPGYKAHISAYNKKVVVIGGGDTGADCFAHALREGALGVEQLEILPEPPKQRVDKMTPWPLWANRFRLSYAAEEGKESGRGEQGFSLSTVAFKGRDQVEAIRVARADDSPPFTPVEGSESIMPTDLVLLAMGFLHPEQDLPRDLGCDLDTRGNIRAGIYETSVPGVFAAGDARRGQSLIVWAINEGRQCARVVERYLTTV